MVQHVHTKGSRFAVYDGRDKDYDSNALGCLPVDNCFRFNLVRAVDNVWFERLVLLLITVNVVLIALEAEFSDSTFETIEIVFSSLFTLEMIIKLIANGVIMHETAYFRNGWNILDFTVVVIGWLTLVPGVRNGSAIRALRVLRALRTIRRVRGLRVLIETLLEGVPLLGHVAILIFFGLLVFAIFGINLWGGLLRQRCRSVGVVDSTVVCSTDSDFGLQCPSGYECIAAFPNPDRGFTSFDHFGWGFLTAIRVFSGDEWAKVMFYIWDAWSSWGTVLFVALVSFATFFAFNYVLAILFDTYSELNILAELAENRLEAELASARYGTEQQQTSSSEDEDDEDEDDSEDEDSDEDSCEDGDSDDYTDTVDRATDTDLDTYEDMSVSGNAIVLVKRWMPSYDPRDPPFLQHPFTWLRLRTASAFSFLEASPESLRETYLEGKPGWVSGLRRVTDSAFFAVLIGLCIFASILLLALEHASMSEDTRDAFDVVYIVFVGVFTLEMLLKLVSMGFAGYLNDRFNWLDALVVVVSLIEVITVSTTAVIAFRALRASRVLRLFHSARWNKYMRVTLDCLYKSLLSMVFMVLLMLLFAFIFALIGRQLFGGRMTFSEIDAPRSNFRNVYQSLITVFIIMTGKGFQEVMYDTMAVEEWYGSLFGVAVFVFGQIILVNMFVVVLLNNWDPSQVADTDSEDEQSDTTDEASSEDDYTDTDHTDLSDDSDDSDAISGSDSDSDDGSEYYSEEQEAATSSSSYLESSTSLGTAERTAFSSEYASDAASDGPQAASCLEDWTTLSGADDNASVPGHLSLSTRRSLLATAAAEWNCARASLARVVLSYPFELLVDVLVLFSAVAVCFDSPAMRAAHDSAADSFDAIDYVVFALFALEFLARFTVYTTHEPLLIFDVAVVACSFLGLPFMSDGFRFLRAARVLRALRVCMRLRTVRVMMYGLYKCVQRLMGPLLVFTLIYVVFTLMGQQLFMGKFSRCSDAAVVVKSLCTGSGPDLSPRVWLTPTVNFDDFGQSLVAMFHVTTLVGWSDVMYAGMDGTHRNEAPSENFNEAAALFFIVFVVIQVWMVLPLFLCAVVDTFVDVGQTLGGTLYERNDVRELRMSQYVHATSRHDSEEYEAPEAPWRASLFSLVTHRMFEIGVAVVIAVNTVYLCLRHYDESDDWGTVLDWSNLVFVIIYAVEAAVKIAALGHQYFWPAGWNLFDFGVLVIAVVGVVVELVVGTSTALSVFRVLRVLRTVRLLTRTGRFQALFVSLVRAIYPTLCAAGAVFVILATLANISVAAFAGEALTPKTSLNDNESLRHWGAALVAMFRLWSGDVWPDLVNPLRESGSKEAIPLYMAFWALNNFVLLHVFVSIVFESYGEAYRFVRAHAFRKHLLRFRRLFIRAALDHPAARKSTVVVSRDNVEGAISPWALINILHRMPGSLHLPVDASRKQRLAFFAKYNIPLTNAGTIEYLPALHVLFSQHVHCSIAGAHDLLAGPAYKRNKTMHKAIRTGDLDERSTLYSSGDRDNEDYDTSSFV